MSNLGPDAYGAGLPPEPSLQVKTPEALAAISETRHQATRAISIDYELRCQGKVTTPRNPRESKVCNKLLAEYVARPFKIICPRCKYANVSQEPLAGPISEHERRLANR